MAQAFDARIIEDAQQRDAPYTQAACDAAVCALETAMP
jgi:hypothetical protein